MDGDRPMTGTALTIVAGALMIWQGLAAYYLIAPGTGLGNTAFSLALAGSFGWAWLDGLALVALGVVLGLAPKYRSSLGVWIMVLSLLSLVWGVWLLFAAVVGAVGGLMAIRLELAVDAPADSLRVPHRHPPPPPFPAGSAPQHLPTTRIARGSSSGVLRAPVPESGPDGRSPLNL